MLLVGGLFIFSAACGDGTNEAQATGPSTSAEAPTSPTTGDVTSTTEAAEPAEAPTSTTAVGIDSDEEAGICDWLYEANFWSDDNENDGYVVFRRRDWIESGRDDYGGVIGGSCIGNELVPTSGEVFELSFVDGVLSVSGYDVGSVTAADYTTWEEATAQPPRPSGELGAAYEAGLEIAEAFIEGDSAFFDNMTGSSVVSLVSVRSSEDGSVELYDLNRLALAAADPDRFDGQFDTHTLQGYLANYEPVIAPIEDYFDDTELATLRSAFPTSRLAVFDGLSHKPGGYRFIEIGAYLLASDDGVEWRLAGR